MSPAHQPWIILLSVLMAVQGSYVGLYLARQVGQARGTRYRQLITFSALSLALGVWTMHFVGMLALQLPFNANFLVLPTLISFLVCILVIGVAVFVVARPRPSGPRIAVAAVFMGSGIVAMHYIGMLALHAGMHMAHSPVLVIASVVVGIAAAGLSLWLGFAEAAPRSVAGSALVLALAISAMHYTAMWGTTMVPHMLAGMEAEPALSPGALALLVTGLAFTVLGLFLLTLVPMPADGPALVPSEAGPPPVLPSVVMPLEAVVADAAQAPPRTLAFERTLPVEQAGLRRSLDISRLIAVQAQAHYTRLFDGDATWFCPLTISEVEARLDAEAFIRIHRSHIVRLASIAAMQRSGDAAIVELRTAVGYRAPVARSRRAVLKGRLEAEAIALI